MISGFWYEVHENCDLLGCYAVSSGNFLATFRDHLTVLYSRAKKFGLFALEDGAGRLPRKVGKDLPLLAA